MTALIVCTSVSHGNTLRVAQAMAGPLDARVLAPGDVDPAMLDEADIVGFGSGIFTLDFHPELRGFVASLPVRPRRAAFVFATSGLPEPPFRRYIRSFGAAVAARGFRPVGSFHCRGYDTWAPFRPLGGIRRSHPDADDLSAAARFAATLPR